MPTLNIQWLRMNVNQFHIVYKSFLLFLVLGFLSSSTSHASSVNFYGHSIEFQNYNFTQTKLRQLNQNYINRFEKQINENFIAQLSTELKYKQMTLNLDDIGMLKLLDLHLQTVYADHNRRTFLRWKILSHLKYDVILTYSGTVLDCFGTMNFKPLNNVYIIRKNKRYNNINFNDKRTMGNRFIYNGGSNGRGQKLQFDSRKRPRIFKRKRKKQISFKYNQVDYTLSAEGNGSLMDYYNDLPPIDFSKSYINSGFSELAMNSVIKELKDVTSEMSKRESIGFLLRFVQSSFNYKTDYLNHGHEKYNFPEETLFASFSDCEDRSLLLAGLVKEILGLNSVALYFEKDQHMSLAIEMSEYTHGFSFKYDNRLFVACEPTGRYYRFGQSAISLERVTRVYKLY
jgi:hypothetical protein